MHCINSATAPAAMHGQRELHWFASTTASVNEHSYTHPWQRRLHWVGSAAAGLHWVNSVSCIKSEAQQCEPARPTTFTLSSLPAWAALGQQRGLHWIDSATVQTALGHQQNSVNCIGFSVQQLKPEWVKNSTLQAALSQQRNSMGW